VFSLNGNGVAFDRCFLIGYDVVVGASFVLRVLLCLVDAGFQLDLHCLFSWLRVDGIVGWRVGLDWFSWGCSNISVGR